MRIAVPDDGALRMLSIIFREGLDEPQTWQFVLFENPAIVGPKTVWADIEECTWNGYSRRLVLRDQWQEPAMVNDVPEIRYGTDYLEWQVGGDGATVWGWLILEQITQRIIVGQTLDESLLAQPLQRVRLWPRVQLGTLVVCS